MTTNGELAERQGTAVLTRRDLRVGQVRLLHSPPQTIENRLFLQLRRFCSRLRTALLEESIPIIENLYGWVNGTSFSVENSRGIDRKNAQALWHGCKFDVLR